MTTLMPVRHLSTSIERTPQDVYAFAGDPRNLPKWAKGLSQGIVQHLEGEWLVDSPMGRVKVRFAPGNEYGVLDHAVTLPSGQTVHNPLRVIPNGTGSELTFTLFRRPEMSDAEWGADAEAVVRDLQSLKRLLESDAREPPHPIGAPQ